MIFSDWVNRGNGQEGKAAKNELELGVIEKNRRCQELYRLNK